ncbi:hypothetical protein IRJ41_015295 [Triplophysa rosa]|uniref:Uncharacterized protein n=1 Tax=Triplophysa rosa TaxID=992332 RepID=A0A9W7TCZ0_TRIRA|nr:hypothetical protein IRJ41_015295 [Triplophysa rosa]
MTRRCAVLMEGSCVDRSTLCWNSACLTEDSRSKKSRWVKGLFLHEYSCRHLPLHKSKEEVLWVWKNRRSKVLEMMRAAFGLFGVFLIVFVQQPHCARANKTPQAFHSMKLEFFCERGVVALSEAGTDDLVLLVAPEIDLENICR